MTRNLQIRDSFVSVRKGCIVAPITVRIVMTMSAPDFATSDRLQINFRLTPETIHRLDQKRIELHPRLGRIPSRSEVMRYMIDACERCVHSRTAPQSCTFRG
jgi:hypothetical protein